MKTRHRFLFLRLGVLLASTALSGAEPPTEGPTDERFGVMTHFAHGWDPALIPSIAQGEISQIRDEIYWANVEPRKNQFSFPPAFDRYMADLKQARISPFIVLSFENPNYDGNDTPHTADGIAAYGRYAVEVLRHYGSQIKAVEIWNEYNGSFARGPATQDRAATYAQMLRAAYTAIKKERPDVTVVGGATSGIPLPYWRRLIEQGALEYVDAISVHPYRYDQPPEGLEHEIAGLRELMRADPTGKVRPIWVSEIGWYTKAAGARGDLPIDDRVQAQFLVRSYALLLSADVARIYWYLYRDYQGLAMGLVREESTHSPKLAYRAFATLARQLRGARFVQREPTPADLYSLVFQRPNGESVRVMWSLQPRNLPASGVTAIVDLEGRVVDPGQGLSLSESPLFVTGPLRDLPGPAAEKETLTDSVRDFSTGQPAGAWSYGIFQGNNLAFVPLSSVQRDDWNERWKGDFPYLALTATDQHPSASGDSPIAAVRRWVSPIDGRVRISGSFRSNVEGDGVGVSIVVEGNRRSRTVLGGGRNNSIVENFDFVLSVRRGSTVDFAVDPGPATNLDFDATKVSVVIRPEEGL